MAQQIRELMTSNPVTMPGTASVHEAARAMRDQDIGDVIVIEHEQVCGIVTDRDIAVRIVAEAQDPAATTLADICSHSLLTVTAHRQRRGGDAADAHSMPFVACQWSKRGRRWVLCRSGIWRLSGIPIRCSARLVMLPLTLNGEPVDTNGPRVSVAYAGRAQLLLSPRRFCSSSCPWRCAGATSKSAVKRHM